MDQLITLLTALAALAVPLLFAWVVVDIVNKRDSSHPKRKTKK